MDEVTPGDMSAADRTGGARPLAVSGIVAAVWCAGIGLAVLTTVTLVGWIAAPRRTALGADLPGVFRTAVNFWLVAHHAGFSLKEGRVGMLPLGLTVLPGALLCRSGGWIIRVTETRGRRRIGVVQVALALAVPYAVLAGLLALTARSEVVTPSAWQAVLAGLILATVAGGLGAARALVAARGSRVRSGLGALLRLLPERPRSLVVGVAGATAMLIASGAVLAGASLAMHLPDARASYEALGPGIVGGFLLFLVELAFLPNAVIWGMAYAVGPGFSVGAGTSVSPTGVFLNVVPLFPPLSALPEPGPAPLPSLLAVLAPFLAGAVGGVLTIRALPSVVYEAAPLWGFLSGALTGCVAAVLAAVSGGPLGGGRLSTVGPSAWQIGVLAALEVGVAAAIAAWVTNWMLLRRSGEQAESRRARRRDRKAAEREPVPESAKEPVPPAEPPRRPRGGRPSVLVSDPVEFIDPEPVLGARRTAGRRSEGGKGDARTREPAARERPEPPERDRPTADQAADPAPPAAEPAPAEPAPSPSPSREPEGADERRRKVENRGGAIYVLKNDAPDERRD